MSARTSFTIFFGVIAAPETIFTGFRCPVAYTFTWVPPISRTSTLIVTSDYIYRAAFRLSVPEELFCGLLASDIAVTLLAPDYSVDGGFAYVQTVLAALFVAVRAQ